MRRSPRIKRPEKNRYLKKKLIEFRPGTVRNRATQSQSDRKWRLRCIIQRSGAHTASARSFSSCSTRQRRQQTFESRARVKTGASVGQRPRISGESLLAGFFSELAVIRFFFLSLSLSRQSRYFILFQEKSVCVFIYFPVRLSAEREKTMPGVFIREEDGSCPPSLSLSLSLGPFASFSALSTCVRFTERRQEHLTHGTPVSR